MTDRELLELAAKAAGLKHVDYSGIDYDGRLGIVLVDEIGRHCSDWNPLADDGDALRLAAHLNLLTKHSFIYAMSEENEKCGGDYCLATRRAIVRAAAEIGRNM